jgi:nucleotide-binding universal stress UspA family protein
MRSRRRSNLLRHRLRAVQEGRAADASVATAAERDSDLMTIGTRGRRATLGSVAEQVSGSPGVRSWSSRLERGLPPVTPTEEPDE